MVLAEIQRASQATTSLKLLSMRSPLRTQSSAERAWMRTWDMVGDKAGISISVCGGSSPEAKPRCSCSSCEQLAWCELWGRTLKGQNEAVLIYLVPPRHAL